MLGAPHQIRASDLRHERAIDAIGRQVARLKAALARYRRTASKKSAPRPPRGRGFVRGGPVDRPVSAHGRRGRSPRLRLFGAADAWRKELQMTIVEYVRGRFRGLLEQFNTETLVEVLKSGWLSARRTPAEGLARSERPPAKRALGSFSPNLTGQLEDSVPEILRLAQRIDSCIRVGRLD